MGLDFNFTAQLLFYPAFLKFTLLNYFNGHDKL